MGEERVRAALRHKLAQALAFRVAGSESRRTAWVSLLALVFAGVLGLGCTQEGGPHPEPPNNAAGSGAGSGAGARAGNGAPTAGRPGGAAGTSGAAGTGGSSSGAGSGGSPGLDAGPMDAGTQCEEDAGVSSECDDAGAD